MPVSDLSRYTCMVAAENKRLTRPKLATTAGILYSRQEPEETLWPIPAFQGFDFRNDEELVTPCQGLLQTRNDQQHSQFPANGFPFVNDLTDVPRQTRANSVADESLDTISSAGNTSIGHGTRATASTSSIHKKTQYHKTKLCPWHKEGKCFMGDVCNYAHSREELRPKPDLSKTKLCPEIAKNKRCDRVGCRFAHDFVELRATSTFFKTRLCKFWQRGYCPAGPECRHAHGREDLRTEPSSAETTDSKSSWQNKIALGPFVKPSSPPPSSFMSSNTATPTTPESGLTPLFMQCAELLSQQSEAEVVQLLRRLAGEGEGLLPQGLLESPRNPQSKTADFTEY